MKAVIYARYSSHNQKEESIEGQLRECHDFADKNELTVVGEYCDRALSGKTDKRPEFQRLIKDSEKGRFDAVILYTMDRFARNRYDSAIYKAKLKKNGVRLFYAKQPLPDTPESIILESVLEGYAEYYSENLARGVKRGMKDKAMQCVALGRPPLGYKIGKDKKYEIDPLGAEAVKIIYDMYIDGYSIRSIFDHLNELGYKSPSGHAFGYSNIHKALRNEKYIGTYKHDDVVVPGGVPSIIDKDKYDRVQIMLEKNKKAKARGKAKVDYLLSGKIFCGHCGHPLIGESGRSKTGTVHHYYKCRGRKRLHNCDKTTERKDWLERIIVDETVRHVLTDDNIARIAQQVMKIAQQESFDNSILAALTDKLKDVNKKIDNMIRAIEDGIITASTKSRLSELEEMRDRLEVQIDEIDESVPNLSEEEIIYYLESFKGGDVSSVDYQKRIINTLVSSVYVYDDGPAGRKIVINFNLSENNSVDVIESDIDTFGVPIEQYPNIFVSAYKFGLIIFIKEV